MDLKQSNAFCQKKERTLVLSHSKAVFTHNKTLLRNHYLLHVNFRCLAETIEQSNTIYTMIIFCYSCKNEMFNKD